MTAGPAVIFTGPQAQAQQVVSMLLAHGIKARLHTAMGGLEPARLSGPFDARVVVPQGEARRAVHLLELNPQWQPMTEEAEARAAQNSYVFFVAAIVAAALVGVALVVVTLTR